MDKNVSDITENNEHAHVLKTFNVLQTRTCSHEKTMYVSVEI